MKKIIPFISILLFANAADAQISSATFGMMEARQIGPATMGGRLTAIEGVNNEPRTIYIGSAGGGVWKTTNGGVDFKSIFDKYCQSIGALAVDQQNPKTIFVGTGESNMRNTVSIGDGSNTAAGSTINQDVDKSQLAVARARQRNIDGWKRPVKIKKT